MIEGNDDRATRESTDPDLSQQGLGDDIRDFLGDTASKTARTRQLRATFRPTPASPAGDPGFPGTRAFAGADVSVKAHRLDRRAAGSTLQATRTGADAAPARDPGTDNAPGRRVALQQAGGDTGALGAGEPAAKSAEGRRVRGRGRPPGSGKAKQAKTGPSADRPAALPAAIKKLVPKSDAPPSSSKIVPTEAERQDARRLFREIGQRFNDNRKKSKTAAYAGFRHDLMDNLDTLVMGGAIDLKEATTIITNLEQYTRETEQESTETPATILGRWLRMDAAEVAGLEVGAVGEEIDANNQIVDEDGAGEGLEESGAVEIVG